MTDKIDNSWIKKNTIDEVDIIFRETIDSTNVYLKSLAQSGAKTGTVVVAENQTAGRGRLGRQFYSPSHSGIYMSLLIRPEEQIDIGMITAHTAVAVCNAIETACYSKENVLGIKWVNDIQKDGKKICGILAEAGIENNEISYIIVGIGINVYPPEEGFPKDIENIAGCVLEKKKVNTRNKIISSVINNFYSHKKDFVSEYRCRSTVIGKEIMVHEGEKTKKAFALDVNDRCNLKVRYENGKEAYLSFGEISVRAI